MKTKAEIKSTYDKGLNKWLTSCYCKVDDVIFVGTALSENQDESIEKAIKDIQDKIKFVKEYPVKIIDIEIDI